MPRFTEDTLDNHKVNGLEAVKTKVAEAIATVKLSPKLVRALKHKFKMDFFFRRVDILAVHSWDYRGVEVSFRFHGKLDKDCNMCGRHLELEISRATGIGPICIQHTGLERKNLNDAKATLEHLDNIVAQFGTKRAFFAWKRMKLDDDKLQSILQLKDYAPKKAQPAVAAQPDRLQVRAQRGDIVKVLVGKQNGPGTVFWYGDDRYNAGRKRVGVKLNSGPKVFVDSADIEMVSQGVPQPQKPRTSNYVALNPGQILLRKWFAAKENLPDVLTVQYVRIDRPKAQLLGTVEKGEIWVPKSTIMARG
jgi:hypothetical protein